jgi:hypothetical protein
MGLGGAHMSPLFFLGAGLIIWGSWGSSVSNSVWLRTGRPSDRGSIPGRARDFSSNLYVQSGSGAHPVSCTMGTRGPFPEGKARPGRGADRSPPSSAKVMIE